MPRRQQRRNTARGQLPVTTLALAADIQWSLYSVIGSAVTIAIPVTTAGMSLSGIPQIVRSDDNTVPVSATLGPFAIVVTYGAPVGSGVTFRVPSKDSALRSAQGGYLAAGAFGTDVPPVIPSVFYFASGFNIEENSVCIPATDGAALNFVAGSLPNNYVVVANPPTNTTAVNLTGPVSVLSVPTGASASFRWSGSAWL